MSEYVVITCPHCKNDFEQKVIEFDMVTQNSKFRKGSDGIFSPTTHQAQKPRTEECPLCLKSINLADPKQYQYRYIEKPETLQERWQNFKRWFGRFLP